MHPNKIKKILREIQDSLSCVLWACRVMSIHTHQKRLNQHVDNTGACLHKKINFIPGFLHKILHFKKFCNWTGPEHFDQQLKNQNSATYGVCAKILITISFFILVKTAFGPFWPKLNQLDFLGKSSSVRF